MNGLLSSGSFFFMNPEETERARMTLMGKSLAAESFSAISLMAILGDCWIVGSWRSEVVQEWTKKRRKVIITVLG